MLVFSMQGGFLLREAGRVRARNSVSVAQKNVCDMVIAWTVYFAFGYALMYAEPGPMLGNGDGALEFLYRLSFCATAASIVSGGIAERMRFGVYLALTVVTVALIYPLVGRWVWGGLGVGWSGSRLAEFGFIDFAGSTVVHGVGAWVALAGIHVLGARHGRFDETGTVQPMPGYSPVLSYHLKSPWRDGTTHVVLEPLDFIARLAALVPKPRVNLTRFHGVFAPNSRYRARVTPAGRGPGARCAAAVEAEHSEASSEPEQRTRRAAIGCTRRA